MPRKINESCYETTPCLTCNKEFRRLKSRNRRFCSKTCSCNNEEVKQKNRDGVKKTLLKNYGCHHMQCDVGKNSFKKSMLEKYGVEHYSQHPDRNDKVKKTLLERYGSENYNNTEKIKNTCLERYGKSNIRKLKWMIDKTAKSRKNNHYNYVIKELKTTENIECLFNREEYVGQNFRNKYKFRCCTCDTVFEKGLHSGLIHVYCEKCFPGRNSEENSVYEFLVEELNGEIIKRRDRLILDGREVDFYIPSKKLAIEYHGLYWHSDKGSKRNKVYHLNKLKSSLIKGIELVQIYSDEWHWQRDIIKSILRKKLGLVDVVIDDPVNYLIKEITVQESNIFLEANHYKGKDKSRVKIGLYHNKELISVMNFRKSNYDLKFEWEISRFCDIINVNVVGSEKLLFEYFLKNYQPKNIVSFSDRRYSLNEDWYSSLGFKFLTNTTPNYYYLDDYKIRIDKQNFQKHKLPNILSSFDKELTEWENMKANGWDRIWDCGSGKWTWRLNCN